MKARVERIKAVKGFLPTTYAVFCGEKVLKIFLTKKEAEEYANMCNA